MVCARQMRLIRACCAASLLTVAVSAACAAPAPMSTPAPARPSASPVKRTLVPNTSPTPKAAGSVTESGRAGNAGSALTIGIIEEPETLNPYLTRLTTSFDVLSGVMEGLLDTDPAAKAQPRLAESYSVSADGLTYTFHLRKDVKWHDGQMFTAADVVATWKIIVNNDFAARRQLGWDKIVSIDTPDDFTVVMKTGEPYAPFLSDVGRTPISPKHEIDKGLDSFKQAFGRAPVGTGPFKLVKWEGGQAIMLEANNAYWGTQPKLGHITLKIVPDTSTLLALLKSGEVQMSAALGASAYSQAQTLDKVVVNVMDGLEWTHIDLKYIGFLADVRVRQALDYATPKQQVVDMALNGLATVSFGDQAPGTPWIDPKIDPRPYSLDQAAKLLAQAGFQKNALGILEKDGQSLALEYWIPAGDEDAKRVQQLVASSWEKLGVQVDLHAGEAKTIWGPTGYQFNKTLTAGQYAWRNSGDPDDMFYWHSSQIPKTPTGTGGNALAFFQRFDFQDQIDRLTSDAVKVSDVTARQQLYWQVQELLDEQVPVIFLYWPKRIYIVPKTLSGFKPNTFSNLLWDAQEWDIGGR